LDLAEQSRRALLSVVEDQKSVAAALRESEARFRAVAAYTPDHVFMQDRELRYQLVVNPQLGLTEADMLGKTDGDLLSPADAEKLIAIKRQVLETGLPIRLEVPVQNLNGETEFFEGAYVPKLDAANQTDGLIGYFRNVTERKRAEGERDGCCASEQTAHATADKAREQLTQILERIKDGHRVIWIASGAIPS